MLLDSTNIIYSYYINTDTRQKKENKLPELCNDLVSESKWKSFNFRFTIPNWDSDFLHVKSIFPRTTHWDSVIRIVFIVATTQLQVNILWWFYCFFCSWFFCFVSFWFCFANKRKPTLQTNWSQKESLCNCSQRGLSYISYLCYPLLVDFFVQGWFRPWIWIRCQYVPCLTCLSSPREVESLSQIQF